LFVASSSADPDADRILRSLVHLARDMGLRTVAEGIETNEVRNRLQDYGCEVGQGWLWAPALKEDALKAWMDRMTPRSTSISDPKTQLPYVSNQEAATS
jgi:EAL domain-containing protein (putative c-di-GMP-specific phosphodiesterase class I)